MSPITPARISDCELVNIERNDFDDMIGPLWDARAEREPAFELWYRRHRSLVNSAPPSPSRVIAWKSNAPFKPENLFFRTVDTGRLLPMSAAEFRIQYWAHKGLWNKAKSRESLAMSMTWMLFHHVILLRSFHDLYAGDIPVVQTEWPPGKLQLALEYWEELSKDDWSKAERLQKYNETHAAIGTNVFPCFPQLDILIRALFADPAVEYLAPFIMLMPHLGLENSKGNILFQRPSFVPPASLFTGWPTGCSDANCKQGPDCSPISWDRIYCLADATKLVRRVDYPEPAVLCNHWGCNKEHKPAKGKVLNLCQRCKEVRYCSKNCQIFDWQQHKRVCEKRQS